MRSAGAHVRSLLVWVVGLTFFTIGALFLLLLALFRRGRFFERCLKLFCRAILAIVGCRVTITGRENAAPGRQYIVVMNHVNLFDGFLLCHAFPGFLRGVEEESHFRWPLYGPVNRRIGNIPISRTSGPRAVRALQRAAALIRARPDFSFAVLPEGTRTRDGRLGPFKRGAFLLAHEAGLEILPVVQRGAYEINRRGSRFIRPGRVEVTIERPVPVAGFAREALGPLVDQVRAVFLRRLQEDPRPPAAGGRFQEVRP